VRGPTKSGRQAEREKGEFEKVWIKGNHISYLRRKYITLRHI
jgi:hypothetical protein